MARLNHVQTVDINNFIDDADCLPTIAGGGDARAGSD